MMLNQGRAGSERVLKPETVELMSRNAMGDSRVTMLHTVMPPVSNDAEFFPGMSKSWGLGFMINNEQAPTGRSAGSLAWAGRRIRHADLPLRRSKVAIALLRIREGRLSGVIGIPLITVMVRKLQHFVPSDSL